MEKVICYVSGASHGNPGPAALGVFVTNETGETLKEMRQNLGNSTDNLAEYMSVMVGLQTLQDMYGEQTREMEFEIRMDSKFVKQQLNGENQIKEPSLVPQFIEIHNMRIASFPNLTLTHVPHAENKEADRLVNEALDVS